jgi:hypothetical protein
MSREWKGALVEGPVTEAEKAKAELERLRIEFKALADDCVGYYLEATGDEIRHILVGGKASRRNQT